MPRTLLPRSALRNSGAVASRAPVDPAIDEKILGPTSEPTSEPTTQPGSQPSSQPDGPAPPVDPRPTILLVHPPSRVVRAGVLGDAEGPIFARDPLKGAARLVLTEPLDFPKQISLYQSIGRLVIFVRRIPRLPLSFAGLWDRYRIDFAGYTLPVVTETVEFEAPNDELNVEVQALVNFAKMFQAPKVTMWTDGHGAELLVLSTRSKKVAEIEKVLKPHEPFLLEGTPSAAAIVAVAGAKPYYEVATEWFDPDDSNPDPPRPRKKKMRKRADAKTVACLEPDYTKIDFNTGAKLQKVEVTTNLAIPLPPVK